MFCCNFKILLHFRATISTITYVAIGLALASAMYRPVNQINVDGIGNTVLIPLR